jgi:hypothetical protein
VTGDRQQLTEIEKSSAMKTETDEHDLENEHDRPDSIMRSKNFYHQSESYHDRRPVTGQSADR